MIVVYRTVSQAVSMAVVLPAYAPPTLFVAKSGGIRPVWGRCGPIVRRCVDVPSLSEKVRVVRFKRMPGV